MKLSVVIVSYNVKYYLEQCLYALRRSTARIDTEIWVVDNASTDGSVEYLRGRFPEVRYIVNKENAGFSRANNQAIVRSSGQYVLLLNPDTIVGEEVLEECVRFLDACPEVGATGVAMLKDNGEFAWESRRGLPTPFTSFCKMSGLCALFPKSRTFGRYYMRYLDVASPNEIEVISGAFNMIRRSALNKAGLLDEDFFMYGEDIDLSYRLLQQGYKNYYLPLHILHYKGESTQKSSFRYVHVFYQAMLIFFDKHYSRRYRLLSLLIRLAVVLRAFIDVCRQQKGRLEQWLVGERPVENTDTYLFVGAEEALRQARELCRRNELKADFVQATEDTHPCGHLELAARGRAYDYVVYDVEAYRYSTIFRLLAEGVATRPVALGTYSVRTGLLITHKDVFQ